MANVSKLLFCSDKVCFLANLDLGAREHTLLRDARKKIRARLKQSFSEVSRDKLGVVVAPRFYTQGSYAYKTINDPAHVPPQQMDLDDGCYLPLTFVKEARPSKAASAFFEVVDAALKDLAAEEGWTFVQKPTCARLVISRDAHVDVPLYAIPDREFLTLEKAAAARRLVAADSLRESVDRWEALPSNHVLLAHREDDWVQSDPRKIHAWFVDAVELYGERLRRACRFLKAWRDFHAPALDSLSSIILMACAWRAFEEVGRRNLPNRDDLALLEAVERLPGYLRGEIKNPSDDNELLCRRLSGDARRIAVERAEQLKAALAAVVRNCSSQVEAVVGMRNLFGDRIPDDASLVSVTEAATAQVMRHEPRQVPAPIVGRSQSG
jgi:hypothetical protein